MARHRSWGQLKISVTNAICDSLGGGALGYSVLLSRDKKYLGLVVQWGAGSSGAISYQLITYRRTHTPIEGGKDDYYGQLKSQWM